MVEKKENKAIKKVTKKVTKAKQEPVEPQYFAKVINTGNFAAQMTIILKNIS